MGRTITEKIIAKAVGREVRIGEFARVSLDKIVTSSLRPAQLEKLGVKKLFDPTKIMLVLCGHDYCIPGRLDRRLANIKAAKKYGIPRDNIRDVGEGGEEHDVSMQNGWVLPGKVYICGIDGQTPINGAMGCVAEPLAHGAGEVIAAILTGKSWIHVPPSIKLNLKGELQAGVSGRDVFEWILGKLGPSGAVGSMLEYTGPAVDEMSIDSRLAMCGHSAFTSAFSGIINPDEKTIDWIKPRTKESFEPLTSDPDAKYIKTFDFDVSQIEPQVVLPPKRHFVKSITEVKGKKIDVGFIGSCSNGRIEDLRIAAKILKGKKIHPDVLLNITPSTVETFKLAAKEGLINTFIEAGAIVPAPGCGMCVGYVTPLVRDQVCVSTSTCNYSGRMGSEEAHIYLAAPATVAASCLEGKLVDAREY